METKQQPNVQHRSTVFVFQYLSVVALVLHGHKDHCKHGVSLDVIGIFQCSIFCESTSSIQKNAAMSWFRSLKSPQIDTSWLNESVRKHLECQRGNCNDVDVDVDSE